MDDVRFLHINLPALLARLTACALTWFEQENCYNSDDMLPGTGQSAKDLAYNAVLEVLSKPEIWRPKTPDEDPFPLLVTIMRHDFLDLVRADREYKRVDILDIHTDESNKGGLDQIPDATDGYCSAEAAALAKSLRPLVGDDPELTDYLDAVLVFGKEKREDIAELLDITPQEVTNRKRRLQTKLEPWRQSLHQTKG